MSFKSGLDSHIHLVKLEAYLTDIDPKSYSIKHKSAKTQNRRKQKKHYTNDFFLQNCEKLNIEIFAFCVLTFETTKI